jgi:hypothetical protein
VISLHIGRLPTLISIATMVIMKPDKDIMHYQPSGKYSILATVYFFVLIFVVLAPFSFLYAYTIQFVSPLPFVYSIPLLAGFYGWSLGWLTNKGVIYYGHVRNPKIALVIAILAISIAYYLQWLFCLLLKIHADTTLFNSHVSILANKSVITQFITLLSQPDLLVEQLLAINGHGTWMLDDDKDLAIGNTKGGILWLLWGVEALLIFLLGSFLPVDGAGLPYCEQYKKWYTAVELPKLTYVQEPLQLIKAINAGEKDVFLLFKTVTKPEQNYAIFTLYYMNSAITYLSITNNIARIVSKNTVFDAIKIVDVIKLNTLQTQQLFSLIKT